MKRHDDKLEAFRLWTEGPRHPGFLVLVILTSAAVTLVVAAAAIAGWLA